MLFRSGAFRITASTSGGDGEGFAFAYSGDGGASWFGLGRISASQSLVDQHWSLATPAFSGSALVRVVDLDRSVGQLALDQLSIDAMAFVSSAPAPGLDPWLGSPGLAMA